VLSFVCVVQRICLEPMTLTGPYTERSYGVLYKVSLYLTLYILRQNTHAQSSDEDDDMQQLQAIEQKLLAHDPTFTIEDTHASISTKRSALLAAFKPLYEEGDIEGRPLKRLLMALTISLRYRQNAYTPEHREMASM
jgi:hypothetical protein